MMEVGRGGACVPARVVPQGRIHHLSLRMMRVFLIWKRRYADVRAGTQAPPLRFRLGRLRVGGFVWVDCVQMVILFVWDCAMHFRPQCVLCG